MITKEETDWRTLFQVQQLEKPCSFNTEPGECNANCLMAKELICTCRCGGRNHGAALRKNVKPLTQFNEPEMLELEVIAA